MNDTPPPIQPSPMPTQWGFDHTPGGEFVVIVANRPSGTDFFFVQPDGVDQFCDVLKAQKRHCNRTKAGKSDTGIVIPAKPILGPDGQIAHVVPPSDEVIDMAEKMSERAMRETNGGEDMPDNVSPFPRPVDTDTEVDDDPLLG